MARDGSRERHGAAPEDWVHWDLVLGLTDDLLPVVSDPKARISERSTLKALGKTPSLFNGRGEAVGIPKWTKHITTGREVEDWSRDGRLGICLQTRRVRAIDIDVESPLAAGEIVKFIHTQLNVVLPRRFRGNSGKCLLLIEVDGDLGKRSFPVEGGMVELLMSGQQCIVAGTHTGGARYQWDCAGGLPQSWPVLSLEAFEALYEALAARFAMGGDTVVRRSVRGEDLALDDAEARWLIEHWQTYGADREGRRLFVECPWKDEHTSDNGETQSAWLMRGAGGYAQGHYRCLHAHCSGRGREDFLEAVGYHESGFTDLSVSEAAESAVGGAGVLGRNAVALPWPGFDRKDTSGVIKASIGNVARALRYAEVCGWSIAYDSFLDDIMIAPPGTEDWRPMTEGDPVRLRILLETNRPGGMFEPISREMMRDALIAVGEERQFDSAQRWLLGLPAWDGVERIERFFVDYMPGVDDAYGRAMGAYVWSAHAGRIADPGCQVDMSPVLVGAQGLRKTHGIRAIAPDLRFFVEMSFHESEADRARKMRGTLVVEMAELRGLNSKEAADIKAFMSRPFEAWIPKFKERTVRFPRRLLIWGTSNEDEILADPTGERRWLPRRVIGRVDVEAIERDRDQLWAEGLARYRRDGVAWREAEVLAAREHGAYRVVDPWEERIAAWLDEPDIDGTTPRGGKGFKLEAVAVSVLGLDFARVGKKEEMRIAKILRVLGMKRDVLWADGKSQRLWHSVLQPFGAALPYSYD